MRLSCFEGFGISGCASVDMLGLVYKCVDIETCPAFPEAGPPPWLTIRTLMHCRQKPSMLGQKGVLCVAWQE